MIHICTFILLLLSGERDFAVNLNKPFDLKLPLDLPPFNGNHADLLVVCLHKVIVNGFEKLNSVYNCFLTIISNISPYIKRLNMVQIALLYFRIELTYSLGVERASPAPLQALFAAAVFIRQRSQPPSRLLPPRYVQQHHPVPVRRYHSIYISSHFSKISIYRY